MRRLGRNRARGEDEESVFVTMTDMTISFLLIIMILLAFFATMLNDDETISLSSYEQVRQERDELREENESLRAVISVFEAELAQVRIDLGTITTERDQLNVKNEMLIVLISDLKAQNDELREENESLRAVISVFEAELAQVRIDLGTITTERDQLNVKNEMLIVLISDLKAQNDELRAQIEQLIEEVERLRNEMKWLQGVNPLEAYLSQAVNQRREILVELRERLKVEFPELQVEVSPEQDALRFQGEGLFRSGSSQLKPRQREIVDTMGRLLDEVLTCFTLGEKAERGPECESGNALIEAVQIEGHTDSDGSDISNLRLSTDRANTTLFVMLDEDRTILSHQNLRGQPVMSVSGYGEMRPIETNETRSGKAGNRRIDLRIIMYAPSTVDEVEEIGRRLDLLRSAGKTE